MVYVKETAGLSKQLSDLTFITDFYRVEQLEGVLYSKNIGSCAGVGLRLGVGLGLGV